MSSVRRVTAWWRRIRAMTVKELLQFRRDPILVGFIVYAFTVNLYFAGRAVSFQLREAATVVSDADRTPASRELISHFRRPVFRVIGEVERPRDGVRLLDEGRAMVSLDVPPGFEKSVLQGGPATVQMQVDATNTGLAVMAANYGAQIVAAQGADVQGTGFRTPPGDPAEDTSGPSRTEPPRIVNDLRLWFNPNATDAWGATVIELLVMVTVLAILLPASAMVREKERGTVEQLLISPLSATQILLPKIIAMVLVTLLSTAVSLFGILRLIFHVPVRGSLALFFLVTTLYVFTTTGLGLLLSTVARSVAQVGMLVSAALPPMVFLSGAWSPPEAMPRWLRVGVTDLIPLHYYLDIGFGILLKGAGMGLLWRPIATLVALGSVIFGLGVWRFRRQFG